MLHLTHKRCAPALLNLSRFKAKVCKPHIDVFVSRSCPKTRRIGFGNRGGQVVLYCRDFGRQLARTPFLSCQGTPTPIGKSAYDLLTSAHKKKYRNRLHRLLKRSLSKKKTAAEEEPSFGRLSIALMHGASVDSNLLQIGRRRRLSSTIACLY